MVKLKNLLGGDSPLYDGSQETLTDKVEHSDSPYEEYSTPITDFTSPLELDNYTKAVIAHHGQIQALKEALYMKRLLESFNNKGGGGVSGGGGDTPDDVIINQNNGNGGEYALPNMLLGKYVSLGDSPYDAVVVRVKPNGEVVLRKEYNAMNTWSDDHVARDMADAFLEQTLIRNQGDISGLHGYLNLPDPEYAYKVAKTLNEKYFGEGKIKQLAQQKEKLLLIEQDLKKNKAGKDKIESVQKAVQGIDDAIMSLHKGDMSGKIAKSLIDATKFSELITQTDNIITEGYDNTLKGRGVVVDVQNYIDETKKNNEYLLNEYFNAKSQIINKASEYAKTESDKELFGNTTPDMVKTVYNKMVGGLTLTDDERKVSQFMAGIGEDLSVLSEVSRHKALQNSFKPIGDYLGWSNRNKTLQRGVNENDIMYLIDPEAKMSKDGKNYGASYWHVGLQEDEHKTYSGIAIGGTFADKRDGAIESLIRGMGQGLTTTAKVGAFLGTFLTTGGTSTYLLHKTGYFNTLDKLSPVGSERAEQGMYSSDPYEPTWNFSWDKLMNLTGNFTVDLATSLGTGTAVKQLLLGAGRQFAKHSAKESAKGITNALWADRFTKLATKEVSLLKGVPVIGKYGGRLSFPTIIGGGIIDGQEVWQEGANMGVNPFTNTLATIATIGTVGVLENLVDIEGIGRGILGTKLKMTDIPKKEATAMTTPKSFKQIASDLKGKVFSKTEADPIQDASAKDVFEATVHNTLTVDANANMMAKAKNINKDQLFTETVSENGVLTPKTYRLDKADEALAQKLDKSQMLPADFDKIAQGQKSFVKDGYLYRKNANNEIEKIPLKEVNEYGLTAEEMTEAYKLAAERAKNKFMRYGLLAPYIKIGDKLFNNNASKFLVGSAMEGVTEVLQDISMYGIKSTANAIDLMMGLAVPDERAKEIKLKVHSLEPITEKEKEDMFRTGRYETELDFDQLVEAGVAGALMGGGANIVGGAKNRLTGKTPEKVFIERERAYKEMLAKNYGLDLSKEKDKAELDKIYANSFNLTRMVHLGLEEDYLFNLRKMVKQGLVTATQYAEQEKFINEYKVKNILYGDAFNSAWNKLDFSVESGVTPDIAKAIYMEKMRLKDNLMAKRNRLERIKSHTTPNVANIDDFTFALAQEKASDTEAGNILDDIIKNYETGIKNAVQTAKDASDNFVAQREAEVIQARKDIETYYDTLISNAGSRYPNAEDADKKNAYIQIMTKLKERALAEFDTIQKVGGSLFIKDAEYYSLFAGWAGETYPIKIFENASASTPVAKSDTGKFYTLGEYFGGIGNMTSAFEQKLSEVKAKISELADLQNKDPEKAQSIINDIVNKLQQINNEIASIEKENAKDLDFGYNSLLTAAKTEVNSLLGLFNVVNNNISEETISLIAENANNLGAVPLTKQEDTTQKTAEEIEAEKEAEAKAEADALNAIYNHPLFEFIKDKLLPDAANRNFLLADRSSAGISYSPADAYSAFIKAVGAKALAQKHTGQKTDSFPVGQRVFSESKQNLLNAYNTIHQAYQGVYDDLASFIGELNKVANDFYEKRRKAYAKSKNAIDEAIKEYNDFIAPIEKMKEEVDKELKSTEDFLNKRYSDMVKDIDSAIEASAIDELKNVSLSYLNPKEKEYYLENAKLGLTKFIRYYFYQRNIENLHKILSNSIFRNGEYYSKSYMPFPAHERYGIALREIIDSTAGVKDEMVKNALLKYYEQYEQNSKLSEALAFFTDDALKERIETETERLQDFAYEIEKYQNAPKKNLDEKQKAISDLLYFIEENLARFEQVSFGKDETIYTMMRTLANELNTNAVLLSVINNKEIQNFLGDLMLADYDLMKSGQYDEVLNNVKEKIIKSVEAETNAQLYTFHISGQNVRNFAKSVVDYLTDDFSAVLDKATNPNLTDKAVGFALSEMKQVLDYGLGALGTNWKTIAENRADISVFMDTIRSLYGENLPSAASFNIIANALLRQNYDGMTHEFLLNEININDIDTIKRVLSEISLLLQAGKNAEFNEIAGTGKNAQGIIDNLQKELNALKEKASNVSILKHNQSVTETKDTILHLLNNIDTKDLSDDDKNKIRDLLAGEYYTKKQKNGVVYYEFNTDVIKQIMDLLSLTVGMQEYFSKEKEYIGADVLGRPIAEVQDSAGNTISPRNFPYSMQQRMNAFLYVYNLLNGKVSYVGGLGGTGKTTSLKLAIEMFSALVSSSAPTAPEVKAHFVCPNDMLLENPAYTNYTDKIDATREVVSRDEDVKFYEAYFENVIKNAAGKHTIIVIDELSLYNNKMGEAVANVIKKHNEVKFIYVSDIAQNKHPNNYDPKTGEAVIVTGVPVSVGYPSNIIWRNANYGLSKAIQAVVPKTYITQNPKNPSETFVRSDEKNKAQLISELSKNLFVSEDGMYGVETLPEDDFFKQIEIDMNKPENKPKSFIILTTTKEEAEELKKTHPSFTAIIKPVSEVQGSEVDKVYYYTKGLSEVQNSPMFNSALYTGITRAKEKVVLSNHIFSEDVKASTFSTSNTIPQDMSFARERNIETNHAISPYKDSPVVLSTNQSSISDFKKGIQSTPVTVIPEERVASIRNEGVKTTVQTGGQTEAQSMRIIPVPQSSSAIQEITTMQTAKNNVFDLFSNAFSLLDSNDMIDVC